MRETKATDESEWYAKLRPPLQQYHGSRGCLLEKTDRTHNSDVEQHQNKSASIFISLNRSHYQALTMEGRPASMVMYPRHFTAVGHVQRVAESSPYRVLLSVSLDTSAVDRPHYTMPPSDPNLIPVDSPTPATSRCIPSTLRLRPVANKRGAPGTGRQNS